MIEFPEISISPDRLDALAIEWLETTGDGGFACSTVAGSNTRRYHGMFVHGSGPDESRQVLLSRFDETLVVNNERCPFSVQEFKQPSDEPGEIVVTGCRKAFGTEIDYLLPVADGAVSMRKTIIGCHDGRAILLKYELGPDAPPDAILEIEPFYAFRNYHELRRASTSGEPEVAFENNTLSVRESNGTGSVFVVAAGLEYEPEGLWYYDFHYRCERDRGYDFLDDLYRPGKLKIPVSTGKVIRVVISAKRFEADLAEDLEVREIRRRKQLFSVLPVRDDLSKTLSLAADQLLVQSGEKRWEIVAGYPWFTVWGRDTMIALPGICLVTGRVDEARSILESWAGELNRGMLPNRLNTREGPPEYNTVDATLWFFVAAYSYLTYSGDQRFVLDTVLPAMLEILKWHQQGTRTGIRQGEDGLLESGDPTTHLTWMDACIEGVPVTPRYGKAVEVNALWINAHFIVSDLFRRAGNSKDARVFYRKAEKSRVGFQKLFWNPDAGCLYDVVGGDDTGQSIRPNQLFALSLPFPLLDRDKAEAVLQVIDRHLLTPVGLRTLDSTDSAYRGKYGGDLPTRDGAYHQGTIWPWLLGPYITAITRYRGAAGRDAARQLIEGMQPELRRGAVGSLSEVYDGDEPREPGGAFAQAWSVSEVLRAYIEDVLGIGASRDQLRSTQPDTPRW